MREIKLYECEICGTQYADKIKAKDCELCHKKPKKITGQRYLSMSENQKGYPITVSILFDDGETVTYKR